MKRKQVAQTAGQIRARRRNFIKYSIAGTKGRMEALQATHSDVLSLSDRLRMDDIIIACDNILGVWEYSNQTLLIGGGK